jgi:hypothetical protein
MLKENMEKESIVNQRLQLFPFFAIDKFFHYEGKIRSVLIAR